MADIEQDLEDDFADMPALIDLTACHNCQNSHPLRMYINGNGRGHGILLCRNCAMMHVVARVIARFEAPEDDILA